jgi:ABC-2 type transport system permease protein
MSSAPASGRDLAPSGQRVLQREAPTAPRGRIRVWRDTVSTSFWLGWKIESNWADLLLFVTYSVARPLAASLILVFMYFAVATGNRGPILGFFIVGAAFWPLVLNGVQGMVKGALEDRENHKTLRSIYTAPISYRTYLIGRALAQSLAVGAAAIVVTLAVGRFALDVPIRLHASDVPYLLAALALGMLAIIATGLISVGFALCVSAESWQLPEGVNAALYLVSGSIFPVTVLPAALQSFATVLPLAWWLEAMRRVLLTETPHSFAWASNARVLTTLAALTFLWTLAAAILFGSLERRARRLGILDQESGY